MEHTKSFVNGQPIYRVEAQGRVTYAIRYTALAPEYTEAAEIAKQLGFEEYHSPSFGGGFIIRGLSVPEIVTKIRKACIYSPTIRSSLVVGSPASVEAAQSKMTTACDEWIARFIEIGDDAPVRRALKNSSSRNRTRFFHTQITDVRDAVITELYGGNLSIRSEEFILIDKIKQATIDRGLATLDNP